MYNSRELIKFLKESGIIPRNAMLQAEKEAESMGREVTNLLVQRGDLSLDDLRKIQSRLYGIKFVDLSSRKIPYDVLVRIPEPVARKHNVVMFDAVGDEAHIAVLDLDALEMLDHVYMGPEKKILHFTTEDGMRKTLKQYQRELTGRFGETIRREAGLIAHTANEPSFIDEKAAEHVSVVKIVDTLLSHAILANASYIHVESLLGDVSIRYRLGGRLYDAMVLPHYIYSPLVSRIKMLAGLSVKTKHMVQHGSFSMRADGSVTHFHVSTQPTLNGEKVVIRVASENSKGFMLESLGLSGRGLELVHNFLKQKNGMILVTGEEQSGKTTCMYTLIDSLISPHRSIGTIEDPIEYDVRGISQMRVSKRSGVTFESGIRTLSKNDADVIMVGSIDEESVAEKALETASLSTLVIAGMKSRGAGHALSTLLGHKELSSSLVSSTVSLVVSTRLVKTIGDDKKQYFLSDGDLKKIEKVVSLKDFLKKMKEDGVLPESVKDLKDVPFYKEGDKGYVGQTGIYEVMPVSRSLQDIMLRGGKARLIDEEARKNGMTSFFEEGLRKAILGTTTLDEVFRIHG